MEEVEASEGVEIGGEGRGGGVESGGAEEVGEGEESDGEEWRIVEESGRVRSGV